MNDTVKAIVAVVETMTESNQKKTLKIVRLLKESWETD